MKQKGKVFVFAVIFAAAAGVSISAFISAGKIKTKAVNLPYDPAKQSYYTKPDKKHAAVDENSGIEYIDNELLITLAAECSKADVLNAVSEYHGTIAGELKAVSVVQIRFPDCYTYPELEQVQKKLIQKGIAVCGTPNILCSILSGAMPSDSRWEKEWTGELSVNETWGMKAVHMDQVWKLKEQMKTSVNLGILDTGFYTEHEDLNFTEMPLANQLYDEEGQLETHGTHVAGIAAAGFDNGIGITGIIPTEKRNLYGASVFGLGVKDDKIDLMGLETAFTYLIADRGCKVINLSLTCFGGDDLTEEAVKGNPNIEAYTVQLEKLFLAFLNHGYDFLICKAAGNLPETDASCDPLAAIDAPEVKGRILVVGAAKQNEDGSLSLADYSSPGERVDLIAPGGGDNDIYSTIVKENFLGKRKGSYGGMMGTSMAAPYVSGTAVLLASFNPSLDGSQIKEILCSTADNCLVNDQRDGLLNAEKAASAAIQMRK
ncbi:Subtilisin DY [uncultured Roseburia sp.]|uniref:S8 family serine peptidase n=1 Tax=Brotonthovivens ammoniilytica TaxID=2981725 RepID=A0ABT2TQB9_9FIRM|nr:S8 family serine peptidase [Brotonthovivens ammoniilytica]MCU6763664.1 S8 family serine peptidase [Brotonthovivens ammoniilytica]SCJ29882.1 Subtilisin DY [uncultured Roseburia sp.]